MKPMTFGVKPPTRPKKLQIIQKAIKLFIDDGISKNDVVKKLIKLYNIKEERAIKMINEYNGKSKVG